MSFQSRPAKALLLVMAVLAAGIVPKSADDVLLRIDARQRPGLPADLTGSFLVRQQLESCWIVEASMEDYARFDQAGGSGSILDPAPAGKEYYLLSSVTPGQFQMIASLGNAIPIENDVVFFWSENEHFAGLLPRNVHLKSLPSETRLHLDFNRSELKPANYQTRLALESQEAIEAIADMTASVSAGNIRSYIQDLENFQTRRVSTVPCETAGTYLHDFFISEGIATEYDSFEMPTYSIPNSTRNIVATIPGKGTPERIILIGAHYDSTSNQPFALAPGADDNASGTAAVMEVARLMRDHPFDATLRFVCFSGEELGLYGSRHYAESAARAGEQIQAMINLDMIGFTATPDEDLDIITNYGSSWLADLFLESARSYTELPALKSLKPSIVWSDHSPFWDQGYSAVLGIESEPLKNPYYHKTSDTLTTLNLEFAASTTKAVLATAASLAHPLTGNPQQPYGLTARSSSVRGLFRNPVKVALRWKSDDPGVAGYNVYRAEYPYSNFARINADPVRQPRFLDYYVGRDAVFHYVVTALDSEGNESAYSRQLPQ